MMQFVQSRFTTRVLIAAILLAFTVCAPLAAQTNTAPVAGTVLDQTGQALPNATVTIKNEATGAVRTAMTGADGRFKADGVPTGFYTITVSAANFATENRTEVEVALGKSDALSITLAVGSVSQTVEVVATASLAAHNSPSQGTLEASSAMSLISPH